MAHTIDISIISSTTGGEEAVAYNRDTTIARIQHVVESAILEHIPSGQISAVKMRTKKPAGALRRYMRGRAGVRVTSIQLRIAVGNFQDMDRGQLIEACKAAVPEIVTANVPAAHLCSLVTAVKGEVAR